jgi:hypothetical protein
LLLQLLHSRFLLSELLALCLQLLLCCTQAGLSLLLLLLQLCLLLLQLRPAESAAEGATLLFERVH